MIEIIFKNKINKHKMETLLELLKSWNVDAEVKESKENKRTTNSNFTLSKGMWKDFDIDANQLRKEAWKLRTYSL
jgi:hypothetical protein